MSGRKIKLIILAAAIITAAIAFAVFASDAAPTFVADPAPGQLSILNSVVADQTGTFEPYHEIEQADSLVCENKNFALYLNQDEFFVKVQDKRNGYIWSSAIPQDKTEGMNDEWQRYAMSAFILEYYNATGGLNRSLSRSDKTRPTFSLNSNGFSTEVEFAEAEAKLTAIFTLTESGLSVEIPDASITRTGENIPARISVMPFFGAVYKDEIPGYSFIPDGSGALVRFTEAKNFLSGFSGRVYGNDYGVASRVISQIIDPKTLSLPIFGMVHGVGNNAFIAVAESGDAFMELTLSPAGETTDYNNVNARFIYQDTYQQPTGKNSPSFVAQLPYSNSVNAKMHYYLLQGDDADYSGMARTYRSYLEQKGILKQNDVKFGIKLDTIMAEPARGAITNQLLIMTKLKDAEDYVNRLRLQGVDNMTMQLIGYEPNGLNGHKLDNINVESKIGGEKALSSLYNKLSEGQDTLILYHDFKRGYENQYIRGSVAFHANGSAIDQRDPMKPLYQQSYYQSLSFVNQMLDKLAKKPQYMRSAALARLGSELYSEFKDNSPLMREQVMAETQNLLQKASDTFDTVALYTPNAYAFGGMTAAYDLPLTHSALIYETDAVPFLQMVLSGSVAMYGDALNYGTGQVSDLLRQIDFGVYPSYIVTEEPANKLSLSNLNNVFSSRFDDWEENIVKSYAYMKDIMQAVEGVKIHKRHSPVDGLAINDYENGCTIAVNYTDEPLQYANETIPPISAKLIKGGTR